MVTPTEPTEAAGTPPAASELNRVWAAMMLTPDLKVCRSILRGLPVRASSLDPTALRHALRGGDFPPASDYLTVTGDMLDAIDEAAPLVLKPKRGR
jgi:hypothetical protein